MSEYDTYPTTTFDDIIDNINLTDSDFEDPLVAQLSEQARATDHHLRETNTSPEQRGKIITLLNENWRSLIGQDAEVFGDIYQDTGGSWEAIDSSHGSRASMSGFAIQKDQQQQDRLYYKLSSTQGTTTYRFITPV